MITSITVLTLKEGKKTQFVNMTKELVEKSNQEVGCISFNLYEHTEKSNNVAFIENWRDTAAISFHTGTECFQRIVPEILKLCVGEPVVIAQYREVFEIIY